MATLQNIRSKGPLLLVVIGLALFAFIAGDAWQVLQPHQSHDVGEVDGETLSAQDFQKLVEDYTEVIKLSRGTTSLNDQEVNQLRDEVWSNYVNNKLIEKEANKLGLTVTVAEIQDILNAGTHPLLLQSPFINAQTRRFDKDMLNKFLVEYSKMNESQMPAQYVEQYNNLYKFWQFIEQRLIEGRLAQKYQALVAKSLLSNPVEAQNAFDAKVNQYDLAMAAVPYRAVSDSAVTVTDAEVKALYNEKKEQYRQYQETRDVRYIDIRVSASDEDRAAIQEEVEEATTQLATADDYASFVRSVGSDVPFMDLYYNKFAFPADVAARLDSVSVGSIYGPYYNPSDNTINSFKLVAKASAPDSVQFRQIQVFAQTPEKTKALADSIYGAIKGGADFVELAKKYGQNGASNWLTAADYERAASIDAENVKFIAAVNSAKVNELVNFPVGQANIILQVTNRKAMKDKYKVAVIKREVEFSKETYNRAYNEFSQFIAANPTLDKMMENAEEAGYSILPQNDLYSSAHGIGGIRGTKEALRWAFEQAEPGDVSGLYECGDSDHMIVVALAGINPEGYRPMKQVESQLRAELLKDKKAEKLMAQMGGADWNKIQGMNGAVTDSLKLVTFAAPAYVSDLRSNEPLVGAYASVAEQGKVSAPIKGNAAVYVLKMVAKDQLKDQKFDVKAEEAEQAAMHVRYAGRLMNDLYLKANVKDTRYLFF